MLQRLVLKVVMNIVQFQFLYCQCYTVIATHITAQYHTSLSTYQLYQMAAAVCCKFHCCHSSMHWNAIIFIATSCALITASNFLCYTTQASALQCFHFCYYSQVSTFSEMQCTGSAFGYYTLSYCYFMGSIKGTTLSTCIYCGNQHVHHIDCATT